MLNLAVKLGRWPKPAELRHFPRYAVALAKRAIDQLEKEGRPIPHVYTLATPEAEHG